MVDKCDWCGNGIPRTGPNQYTTGIRAGSGFMKMGRLYCSNKCKNEGENSTDASKDTGINNGTSTASKLFSFAENAMKSDVEKMTEKGYSAEAIEQAGHAESIRRKEREASDERFTDDIKKFFLGKKNKSAKELHNKLEEIEIDIKIALSKGNKEESEKLIRQLKHDSSFLVPKTNISYTQYWTDKRNNSLNNL